MPSTTASRVSRFQPKVGKGPSLAQLAYDKIKSSILSFDLRPGLFLNEATLCELTGLGRMPVHQAIHRLQADGLLEVIPRKGLVVRTDSLQDILQLLEARLAIEPNVVALAAQRIQPLQLAELRKLLKQSAALVNQSHRQAFSVIDRAFHGLVAEAAGNEVLAGMLRPLHERSDLMWHLRIMPADRLEVTQQEHEAVLRGIVNRDEQAAWQAMRDHLSSLHQTIVKQAAS
jgi:DNA-binding GntR family transcriptional regulator